MQGWGHTVYAIVEGGQRGYPPGRAFDLFLAPVTLFNVTAIVLGTVEDLPAFWHGLFSHIEVVAVGAFTVEYVLRLWVALEDPRRIYRHPVIARLRYALTPLAIIDVVAILPFYLHLLSVPIDPSVAVLLRALRLVKLLRFTGAFDLVGEGPPTEVQ